MKKNKVERFTLPDFKTNKTTVIKTVWYWQKDRLINEMELRNKPSHLLSIFYKGTIQRRKL